MKYLLDTHIWIWSVSRPEKLSKEIKNLLANSSNELYISAISFWEFVVLVEKSRITISQDIDIWVHDAINALNIKEIPIDKAIAIKSREIDLPHQDPGDRFIAASAFIHELTLITSDRKLIECGEILTLFNNA